MNDFKLYFGTGWEHIISPDATDHILFILALGAVYSFRYWKQVLILVTAFTIGHSLTLALSVYDVVRFSSLWVEFLIPLTIVLTAVINLIKKHPGNFNINYVLALTFGLIHGMGFANTIRFMLAEDQSVAIPLLSFNLGLEAGQILVVMIILVFHYLFVEKLGVSQKLWIWFLSLITLIWGAWLAYGRIPFNL